VVGSKGELYGTTQYGTKYGVGTVFELTPPSSAGEVWTETNLHVFKDKHIYPDGAIPQGLALATYGTLYGTTLHGGVPCTPHKKTCGVVYKLVPPTAPGGHWAETVLHAFAQNRQHYDGRLPNGLVIDAKGAVYGTTMGGGPQDGGIVFEIRS
jgi:uncharacterized repeat protein (TIGR03803 family)